MATKPKAPARGGLHAGERIEAAAKAKARPKARAAGAAHEKAAAPRRPAAGRPRDAEAPHKLVGTAHQDERYTSLYRETARGGTYLLTADETAEWHRSSETTRLTRNEARRWAFANLRLDFYEKEFGKRDLCQIIGGRKYDTGNADLVHSWEDHRLYRTGKGNYFVHTCSMQPANAEGRRAATERITPYTLAECKRAMEKVMTVELYEKIFGAAEWA